MSKIKVNEAACIGCGACISLDSEHFTFSDEGLSEVISNDNLNSEDLKTAIESCPTNAISLENCTCENCECNDECHCENCECENGSECTCNKD